MTFSGKSWVYLGSHSPLGDMSLYWKVLMLRDPGVREPLRGGSPPTHHLPRGRNQVKGLSSFSKRQSRKNDRSLAEIGRIK